MVKFKFAWPNMPELRQRIANALYVPTSTGSHDMGDHYLGDIAGAYVEINHYPEAGRKPFHRIQIQVKP